MHKKGKKHKLQMVDAIKEALAAEFVVVVNNNGLSAEDLKNFRNRLNKLRLGKPEARPLGYLTTKNRLVKVALKESAKNELGTFFKGSTAVIHGAAEDSIMISRVIDEVSGEHAEKLRVVGGSFMDKAISPQIIGTLSKLPSLDGMRASFIATLLAPASRLARTIQARADKMA